MIEPSDIEIHSFTTDGFDLEEFNCEKPRFNEYLKNDAKIDHSSGIGRVFLFVYKTKVIGFVTVAMGHLPKDKHNELQTMTQHGNIPGLLLGQLARHSFYNKDGVGKYMLDWVINHSVEISQKVGCRIIIVKSDDDKVDWYIKNGFTLIKGSKDKLFYDILK